MISEASSFIFCTNSIKPEFINFKTCIFTNLHVKKITILMIRTYLRGSYRIKISNLMTEEESLRRKTKRRKLKDYGNCITIMIASQRKRKINKPTE